jgi:hypothetical protein
MNPQLHKGINLGCLLDDVLPLEVPPVGLEDSQKIPSMLINVNMTMAEKE